jgi:hypothetical protein
MKTIYAAGPAGLAFALVLSGQAIAAGATEGADTQAYQATHPTFSQLDIDGNGVLSKGEAAGTKGLLGAWDQTDRNSDNAIERSEFAAFESMGSMLPAIPPGRSP